MCSTPPVCVFLLTWMAAGARTGSMRTWTSSRTLRLIVSSCTAASIGAPGPSTATASASGRRKRLHAQAQRGAQGLKIWKGLGLNVRDHKNLLVSPDDQRLDPIWAAAAELKWPVTVHVADPVAFFDPLDENNERFEELSQHPDWYFPSPPYPSFLSVVNAMATVVRTRIPGQRSSARTSAGTRKTWTGWPTLLDRCPNFNVDIGARISELGRQPYSARRFLIRYADRVVFGTDQRANMAWYEPITASSKRTTNTSPTACPRCRRRAAGASTACICPTMSSRKSTTRTRPGSSCTARADRIRHCERPSRGNLRLYRFRKEIASQRPLAMTL